jgi:polysaccharide deacetylase family sporulation protein PdaB
MPIHSVETLVKRVALTFDAAWGDQNINEIVDTLKRYSIKTTFFLTGAWVDKYPALVQYIDEAGQEIGNHSLNHVNMTELSRNKVISEIKEADIKINMVTGRSARLFRVPFGEYNSSLINTIKSMNYKIIQWDVDSLDWENVSEQEIYHRVVTKTGSGSIVLFHSNSANTQKVLPKIIEKLRKDGYKLVPVSELLLKDNYYIDNLGRQKSLK